MRYWQTVRLLPLAACLVLAVGCGESAPPEPVPVERDDASGTADATRDPSAGTPAPAPPEPVAPADDLAAAPAPPPPEWQPELAPPSADRIAATLQQADEAYAAGRLERGPGDALSLYLSVLAAAPDNAAAMAGVERIQTALIERIEAALAERRYADAAAPLPALRRLLGDDPRAAEYTRRVAEGREVAEQLERAQALVDAGRVLEPPQENAAAVYARILARDPNEPAALAALARLESQLVAQATAAAEAGDYARSDRLLADAARLRPGSGDVQNASTRIVEMRQDRAGQLLQQAHDAAAAGEVTRAEQLLRQLEQVSAQSQGIEELRQRIEQARLYGGFAPGQVLVDALASGGSAPEMVVLPVGAFEMGSPEDERGRRKNEGPPHRVTLSRGFALARTEITVAQFADFVRASGYESSAQRRGRSTVYDERTGTMAERRGIDWRHDHGGRTAAPALPVVHVSWNDAKAYADWLARETGESYRLPSEAEFEYALRAGSSEAYPWGSGTPTRAVANLTGALDRSETRRSWGDAFDDYGDGYWGAAPVRSFPASRLALHDMDGNVSEWVEDCWHDNYSRAPMDGSAWVNPGCARRVIRGASWASAPDTARAAFRINSTPEATNARVGFRVARDL